MIALTAGRHHLPTRNSVWRDPASRPIVHPERSGGEILKRMMPRRNACRTTFGVERKFLANKMDKPTGFGKISGFVYSPEL